MTGPDFVNVVNYISASSRPLDLYCGDEKIGQGTGFVVALGSQYFLISNRHVLAGRKPGSEEWVDPLGRLPTKVVMTTLRWHAAGDARPEYTELQLIDADHHTLLIEHPKFGSSVDVVALALPNDLGVPFYPVDFDRFHSADDPNKSFAINAPDTVMIVGYPLGLDGGLPGYGVWVQGTIASHYTLWHEGLPRFLVDSRTRQGLSGSPVYFYPSGRMVTFTDGSIEIMGSGAHVPLGIYSGRVDAEADLGYVWRAEVIKEIVQSASQSATTDR